MGAIRHAERLEAAIQKLKEEVAKLEKAERALTKFDKTVGDKAQEQAGLLETLGILKQIPLIVAGAAAMDNADAAVLARSAKASFSPGFPPHPTPTPGPSSSALSPTSLGTDPFPQE